MKEYQIKAALEIFARRSIGRIERLPLSSFNVNYYLESETIDGKINLRNYRMIYANKDITVNNLITSGLKFFEDKHDLSDVKIVIDLSDEWLFRNISYSYFMETNEPFEEFAKSMGKNYYDDDYLKQFLLLKKEEENESKSN